jgi:integrase
MSIGSRVYRRDDSKVWQAVYYQDGQRTQRSTHCTDRKAAEAVLRQWERDAADPAGAAARTATLKDVLHLSLKDVAEQAKAGRKSQATVTFYQKKSGHWIRIFGEGFLVASLAAPAIDDFISQRRGEEASDSTIHKELTTLRRALKRAKRAKLWRGDIDEVFPTQFSPAYKPRERALAYEEFPKLLDQLTPDRAARVAFMVLTSAEQGASDRAQRGDIRSDRTAVVLRGTKNANRQREVPITLFWQHLVLPFVIANARGEGPDLFRPWQNIRRDLHAACDRANIAHCSPNDLRRTFGRWMRMAGVEPQLIAPAMGHADSRMVERVYGRLSSQELGTLIARQAGQPVADTAAEASDATTPAERTGGDAAEDDPRTAPTDRHKYVTDSWDVPALLAPMGRSGVAKSPGIRAQRRSRTADTGIFNPRTNRTRSRVNAGRIAPRESRLWRGCVSGRRRAG